MREELEKLERIEKFFLGRMSKEELDLFHEEMDNNHVLKEEVEVQKLLMEGAKTIGLRRELDRIHAMQNTRWEEFLRKNWWKFGLGILLLTLSILIFYSQNVLPEESRAERLKRQEQLDQEIIDMGDSDMEVKSLLESKGKFKSVLPNELDYFHRSFIESYKPDFYFLNSAIDTFIYSPNGAKVIIPSGSFEGQNGEVLAGDYVFSIKEINKKSDIVLNDLAEDGFETFGGLYLEAKQKDKNLKIAKEKELSVEFKYHPPVHVNIPDLIVKGKKNGSTESKDYYYKVFDELNERRIIILPAVVLDYDIIYTAKSNDPIMNEKIESLLLPEYENTFTSTTQFHYRIEGCQLYGEKTELLEIYLSNTKLKLWQADSLVEQYLMRKAELDCNQFERWMKAAEYFRWLKSLKHGAPERIHQLDYRNYRKGQFYNKLPDKVLEKYLADAGLSEDETAELIGYFKKMFVFRKMFLRQTKFKASNKDGANLDYYYSNYGKFINFQKVCRNESSARNTVDLDGEIISARELNSYIPLRNLGWVSHDRFINYKNSVSLKVNWDGDSLIYAKTYIVFKNFNMVMGGKWTKTGVNFFEKLPAGAEVYLVVIGYHEDKIYKAIKECKLGVKNEIEISLEMVSEEELVRVLRFLDQ